jgi:hypothetical protein
MKLTAIIGTAIAAIVLAACGSTAVTPPTARPTLSLAAAPTVASTPTATPAPTPTATPIPTPSPSDSPSPSLNPCVTREYTATLPCDPKLVVASCDAFNQAGNGGTVSWTGTYAGDNLVIDPIDVTVSTGTSGTFGAGEGGATDDQLAAGDYTYRFTNGNGDTITSGPFTIVPCTPPEIGYTTTCAVAGTTQGGSLIITFTGDWPGTSGTYPNSITVGGNNFPVTINPATLQGFAVGSYDFTTNPQGVEPVNEDGWPFSIAACPVPLITVQGCDNGDGAGPGGTASVAWTGTDANDELVITPGDIVINPTDTSGLYGPLAAGTYGWELFDALGNDITRGQIPVATCAVPNAYTDTFPHA